MGGRSPAGRAGSAAARFIADHQATPLPAVRALASVSPALALIASLQLRSLRLQEQAGRKAAPGSALSMVMGPGGEAGEGLLLRGTLSLVPTAASSGLLIVREGQCHIVPFNAPGVTVTPTPAIGFRPAALPGFVLDCKLARSSPSPSRPLIPLDSSYLAIALAAGDYLSRRAQEHASGRVQFPGQMLDTEGATLSPSSAASRPSLPASRLAPSAGNILWFSIRNPQSAFRNWLFVLLPLPPLPSVPRTDAWPTMRDRCSADSPIPRTTCCHAPTGQQLFRFLPPGLGAAAGSVPPSQRDRLSRPSQPSSAASTACAVLRWRRL